MSEPRTLFEAKESNGNSTQDQSEQQQGEKEKEARETEQQQGEMEKGANKRKAMAPRLDAWDSFSKIFVDGVLKKGKCKFCNREIKADTALNGTSGLNSHLKVCEKNPNKNQDGNQGTLQLEPNQGSRDMGEKDKGKVDDDNLNTSCTHGGISRDQGKEVWEDDDVYAILPDCFSFSGRRCRDTSILLGVVPPDMEDQHSEVLTFDQEVPSDIHAGGDTNNFNVQTQVPTLTEQEQTYLELLVSEDYCDIPPVVPEDTTSYRSPSWVEAPSMSLEDNNVIEATELKPLGQDGDCEDTVSGSSAGSSPRFAGAPAKVEQHNRITVATKHDVGCLPVESSSRSAPKSFSEQDTQITVLHKHDVGGLPVQSASSSTRRAPMSFAEIIALHHALVRAWFDPDQNVPFKLLQDSMDGLKNHYAHDVEKYFRNPANAFAAGPRISNFFQIKHGLNNSNSEFESVLRQIKYPANHSIRLINIKGHVLALSVNPYGSRFIQQKLGIATTGEIMMVYKEIMPHVLMLAFDCFANYAIQKLLEHGPPFCRKKLVANLLGHVFGLSLDVYGCQVIQKAFEKSEIDLQIEMAKDLDRNLLECVYDQHANHVVKKCIECVPPQYIQFIYGSLCENAKILSYHPYGFHVVQKALELCNDPLILHTFVLEIAECVNELSAHQFGNYVVQYILEHGGIHDRQIILMKFSGKIVQMSYQKYSSNVIQKCLIYGSYYDRQMITTEILCAEGGQTAAHLVSMMVHQYANYVVQKLLETVDEWQFNVIVDVVRRNIGVLAMYLHGRHVIAHVERLLRAREGFFVSLAAPPEFLAY